MTMHKFTAFLAVASMIGAVPAGAQSTSSGKPGYLASSASPFGETHVTNADAAAVAMPKLDFVSDGTEAAGFDKYYVFHRDETDFATAYSDIAECDGYARGLQTGIGYMQTPYPYAGTMAGALGGALGNAMAVMIFGSAEKRRTRRINMRTCMHFKGYQRYGVPKAVWEPFNFEEGIGSVSDEKRHNYLKQQALVAAHGTVQGKDLGL